MYTDIHSHILPGVDDGAADIAESLELLNMMKQQGIDTVVATPHYHAEICLSPKKHSEKCREVLEGLKAALPGGAPNILLGYEVRYFRGISQSEEVATLKLGNTNHLLIELPPYKISSKVADEIVEFSLNFGVKPIIAHIERYIKSSLFGAFLNIIDEGFAEAQINCDSLLFQKLRKPCLSLIKDGYINYIATDTHSMLERPPHLIPAIDVLNSKLGKKETEKLLENSKSLISQGL